MQHLNLFGRVKALLPTRVETNAIPSEQLLSKALPLGLHPSFPSWAGKTLTINRYTPFLNTTRAASTRGSPCLFFLAQRPKESMTHNLGRSHNPRLVDNLNNHDGRCRSIEIEHEAGCIGSRLTEQPSVKVIDANGA